MGKLLIAVMLVFVLKTSAQINIDSLRMQYNQKTLRFNNRITMNGSLLEPQTVKNLMLISPEATGYYRQYLKNKHVGNALPIFGSVVVIAGIIVAQKNRTPGYIMVLSGNSINLVGSLFRRKASFRLQDAIWHYNRDVLYMKK